MKPGESGLIKAHRKGMTKRRREVLYHVAFGGMHGSRWRRRDISLPTGLVNAITLNGVNVTGIVHWLARQRLIRLWYRPEQPHPAATLRCLCVTAKGIEELLWPTS